MLQWFYMADGASEEVKPKRVPGKRTAATSARKTARSSSTAPRKRATRKRATRKAVKEETVKPAPIKKVAVETKKKSEETVATPERKAPTPITAEKRAQRRARIQAIITMSIILVGIAGSAVIGFTDDGSIDVNQVIEARNERILQSGSGETVVPVQNRNQEPDGGLRGLGVGSQPATTPEPAPTDEVATSTEQVATSTESLDESEESAGQIPLSSTEAEANTEADLEPQDDTTTSSSN